MVIPYAKALYLCDGTIGFAGEKTDVMGVFNSIRPVQYPHVQPQFVVFAQLIGGLGLVPFYVDVRQADTDKLIYATDVHKLRFPTRERQIQLASTIRGCRFVLPGRYLVQLYCDGQWVADTSLELLEADDEAET